MWRITRWRTQRRPRPRIPPYAQSFTKKCVGNLYFEKSVGRQWLSYWMSSRRAVLRMLKRWQCRCGRAQLGLVHTTNTALNSANLLQRASGERLGHPADHHHVVTMQMFADLNDSRKFQVAVGCEGVVTKRHDALGHGQTAVSD
mmetsp:Transcript_32575/g.68875  ORF Transcript_32575/g.68875 Transcript_32575/m.68875 type:complete len:144 (+) Transcript_32575:45-476(+)